ncbi:double-strand break repair helicase AddA [Hyphococcus sp.]|uniref:double-strand break repair helicase AddA n=1 Tax=Hyphococcus sp. TaxID=2038636 RepID=UPI00208117E5|nr:MAG: double-strand break repair helicase AddA [Marinicaulis sp.]
MTLANTALEETTNNQRIAADPQRSVFVMANAGSGKTRVLTNRVARLLLADAPPQKILCITFTKAAAAEMAERLFSVLGEWALASDDQLCKELADLEGDAAAEKPADELAKARRLFARALETPGGLKIQTIHSFCESVLRRFPIEAGAPPGFSVIEDAQAFALKSAALDALAASARNDPATAADFDRLSLKRNETDLRGLLLGSGSKGAPDDVDGAAAALARDLAINPDQSADDVKSGFIDAVNKAELMRARDGLAAGGANPIKAANTLTAYFSAISVDEKWDVLVSLLLVSDQSKTVDKIATAVTDKHDPWVRSYLDDLKGAFFAEFQTLKALSIYADTLAFWRLGAALNKRYGEAKAVRAMLDFDDLIDRTKRLFQQVEAQWIMYKLDLGIDHVLIDEAQDTSPGQWEVVENLFADFFSGAGARREPRSFFAVGDLKQSIYSFQGADVGLFKEKEHDLGQKLNEVTDYKNVQLPMSFRTTAPVLSFVDAAFADRAAAEGLGDEVPPHGVKRKGEAGLVELWPLTPYPEKVKVNPWDAPVDAPESNHPVRVLCDRVADTIKGWRDSKELLVSRGRPIRAGDIMILVQSRGALFRDVIQRLSAAGVPVAGPDRLKLAEDPAVEDLISFARFALTPGDDLSLAETLKSPLFGFEDDADLFPLAYERSEKESLWASLRRRQKERENWELAAHEIISARSMAKSQGPYAFFSHILETGAPAGRKRFFLRLGEVSSDAIDELLLQALDFENGEPRSLRDFVAWFDNSSSDIKREMERDNDSVRVMTVHGAKGLEADIVFLLDAHREPNANAKDPLLKAPRGSNLELGASLLAWAKADDVALSETARAEKSRLDYEEYRRLFYVAATRARDRLYICGVEQGNKKNPQEKAIGVKSWHSLSIDAFDRLGIPAEAHAAPFWPDSPAPLLRLSCNQTAEIEEKKADRAKPNISPPEWIKRPAPAEAPRLQLTPSKLSGEEESEQLGGAKDVVYAPTLTRSGSEDKYFRGRVLHRLLELLPDAPLHRRAAAAEKLLKRLAPDIDEDERSRWRAEVMRVLTDPQFAEVFASGSLAEASIVGIPEGAPASARMTGQIDRLAVSPARVLVVDYKTNRPPPKNVHDADPAYVAQLAAYRALLQEIYPGRQIVCALLWTYEARLMEVPAEMLDHAFARIKKAG